MCIRGQCLNTDGSFLCLCEAGFKFNADMADCEGKTEMILRCDVLLRMSRWLLTPNSALTFLLSE